MNSVPPQPVVVDVSYSVKELFEKVDRKLDRISEQIEAKADKHEVIELEARMARLEEFRWKVVGIGLGAGAVGAGGVVGLLKALGGL